MGGFTWGLPAPGYNAIGSGSLAGARPSPSPRPHTRTMLPRADLEHLARVGYRQARRIVILVIGVTVILVGVAMIVLPGPAFVVIPAGLAILALEFAWARRWLRRLRVTARGLGRRVRRTRRRVSEARQRSIEARRGPAPEARTLP